MRRILVAAILAVAACGGGPSSVSVCDKGCQKTVSCTGGTTADITTCEAACKSNDSLSASLTSCTNASAILSCYDGCYGQSDCNASAMCISGCPKCVTSGKPTDGGDVAQGDMTSASGKCASFCAEAQTCGLLADLGSCESACATATQVDAGTCAQSLACEFSCGSANSSCQAFETCVTSCPQCTA